MKIYTKILIGMAVGVGVGALAGPNSVVAPKNTVHADDGSTLELFEEPREDARRVELPAGIPAKLTLVEEVQEGDKTFLLMAFKPTNRQRLAAEGLGKPGEEVRVYVLKERATLIWGPGLTILAFLNPIGAIFLRLIKMLIVPLVFCSLMVGVASLGDVRQLGRLGGKTLGFFMLTTVLAITIGIVAANVIKPGTFISESDKQALSASYQSSASNKVEASADKPSAVDNIVQIVPDNPIGAMAAKSPNMLQVIFFALIIGVGATLVPSKHSQQLVSLLDKINDAMIMMIHMSMAVAPYGVAALVAKVVGTSGWSVLAALGVYSLVVIAGLMFHATVVYTGFVKVIAKLGFVDFWRVIRPAQLIAFSTSSSAAALPVAMETAKENIGISSHTSSFVIPLGTTINMDGTALYQGVAALFIAQVFGIDLTLGDQLNIILTATLASIGAAAVPGVGMITLAMVLTAVGIPTIGVALILGVDRLLDMFRSAVNVTGNLAATAIIAASEGETPRILSPEEDAKTSEQGFEKRLDVPQHAYSDEDEVQA